MYLSRATAAWGGGGERLWAQPDPCSSQRRKQQQEQVPPSPQTDLVKVYPDHSQSGSFGRAQSCVVQYGGSGLDFTRLVATHGRVVANHINPETEHGKTGHLGMLDEE